MAYIYRQKLNLSELVDLPKISRRVVVYEPNDYLGALYRHYLRAHNFDVKHCPDLLLLKETVAAFAPGLLVFCADAGRTGVILKNFSQNFPSLKIVTTAYNLNQEEVSSLMAFGVQSHINRRFSRPQDLVLLARTLIDN